jgi:hypothetical protein
MSERAQGPADAPLQPRRDGRLAPVEGEHRVRLAGVGFRHAAFQGENISLHMALTELCMLTHFACWNKLLNLAFRVSSSGLPGPRLGGRIDWDLEENG